MTIEDIEITHPDKVLFPQAGITKGDVARYYARISDYMLPFLKDRPVTLQRFPHGIDKPGFFQKHVQDYFPEFIERIRVKTREGHANEILVNNKKSLIYLANQLAITFHIWLSRKGSLEYPDKLIFDLDPSDTDFGKLRKGAGLLKDQLECTGYQPRLMTTGKKGLHIYAYIEPVKDFEQVRKEARELARKLADGHPELFTLEIRKNKRGNKIYVDIQRNAYGQTGVCPFSLRPIPTAGIATPLEWHELYKIASGDQYHYGNIFRRLGALDNQ